MQISEFYNDLSPFFGDKANACPIFIFYVFVINISQLFFF